MSKRETLSKEEVQRALGAPPFDEFIHRSGAIVVLIGSVARSCQTRYSDVDLLLVGDFAFPKKRHFPDFEFHVFTPSEFVRLGLTGDDFPNWCARFGLPIRGKTAWKELIGQLGDAPWPDWRKKIDTATKRLVSAELFVRCGDYDAAREQLLFGYDHLSRGLLLQSKVFPLSRPELPRQLSTLERSVGERLLALELRKTNASQVKQLIEALKSQLKEIAPDKADIADARIDLLAPSLDAGVTTSPKTGRGRAHA